MRQYAKAILNKELCNTVQKPPSLYTPVHSYPCMGAVEYINEREQSELLLGLYRADWEFGYGEIPGMHTEKDLRKTYGDILIFLRDYETDNHKEQLRQRAHSLCWFIIAEFEVASQSLLTRFPPDVLRGMTKKQYHDLFLRYSAKHPETIWAREERELVLDRLVDCKIIRREWFSQNPFPDQNSSITTS